MNWITDRITPLGVASGYTPFTLEFTAPAGATSVSVWILTGSGGSVTVDDLAFKEGGDGDPVENLLGNGDFEAGLAQWDTGNQVTVSSSANDGTRAAKLGAESFIVQTKPAAPGESFTLTGSYFSGGNSERLEVGFSFWNAPGGWIEDRTIVLANAASYRNFEVAATAPAGTTSMTVWVWSGLGGEITVDGMLLLRGAVIVPDNLLANGGFETGDLSSWDNGGSASVTSDSRTGSGAALLGVDSFLVHNQSANAGETYRFSGFAKTGPGTIHEAGFSFWGANGEWLGDSYLEIPETVEYAAFEVEGVVPAGAVSFSVWLWSGAGSGFAVDDLVLLRADEAVQAVVQQNDGLDAVAQPSGLQTGGTEVAQALRSSLHGFGGGASETGAGDGTSDTSGSGTTTTVDTVENARQLSGGYTGLVHRLRDGEEPLLAGGVNAFRIGRDGRFSGRAIIDGRGLRLRGAFDEDANYSASFRDGRTIELQLTVEDSGALSVTGVLFDAEGKEWQLRLTRGAYSRRQPTERVGRYTLLIPGAREADPMGHALVHLSQSGRVGTLGRLADGRRLTHSGLLDGARSWTLYRLLGRRPELAQVGGELGFLPEDNPLADFDGQWQWVTGETLTPLEVIGSRFEGNPRERSLLSVEALEGAAIGRLFSPERGGSEASPLDWRPNDHLFSIGARRLVGRINPRTGLFRGWTLAPDQRGRTWLEGVVFQKQDLVGGLHRTRGGESGALLIEAGEW